MKTKESKDYIEKSQSIVPESKTTVEPHDSAYVFRVDCPPTARTKQKHPLWNPFVRLTEFFDKKLETKWTKLFTPCIVFQETNEAQGKS